MSSFLVSNGPNPIVLGYRQPEISARTPLNESVEVCRETRREIAAWVECVRSNNQSLLIDPAHAMQDRFDGHMGSAGTFGRSAFLPGHACGVGVSVHAMTVEALADDGGGRC